METLPDQFKAALSRIEPSKARIARAIEAHSEVRVRLETSTLLRKWGVDTVLIGSYARGTGIYPGNDVDIFTKLENLDTSANASDVFGAVRELLEGAYGARFEERARSVKIDFSLGGDESDDLFSVDVVPAVHSGEHWAIPAHDRQAWGADEGRWVQTNPERLAELTSEMNKDPQVDGQGAYVPTVKLMRQVREHHRGSSRPGGLYFEFATYDVFKDGITGDSFAEILAATLSALATRLSGAEASPILDPALATPYHRAPDPSDVAEIAILISTLGHQAGLALRADRCHAAAFWRHILGRNDRGPVFPLPPGCDEQGNTVPSVESNLGRGSDEARGFA